MEQAANLRSAVSRNGLKIQNEFLSFAPQGKKNCGCMLGGYSFVVLFDYVKPHYRRALVLERRAK